MLALAVLLLGCPKPDTTAAVTFAEAPEWPAQAPDSFYPTGPDQLRLVWRPGGAPVVRDVSRGEVRAVRLVHGPDDESLWLDAQGRAIPLRSSGTDLAPAGKQLARWAGIDLLVEGEAPVAPPPEDGEPVQLGALPREHIDSVLKARMPEVRRCLLDAIAAEGTLGGWVVTRFVIDNDGSIRSAGALADTTGSEALAPCLLGVVKATTFDPPTGDGIVLVTYPFLLRPDQAAGLPR